MARKRTKGRWAGSFFLLCLILWFLAFLNSIKREWESDFELNRKVDASLSALNGQDLGLKDGAFSLEILPGHGMKRTARQIELMLRATGDRSGTFTFEDRIAGIFTMSAQAIDRRQYLVNAFLEGYEPFRVDNVILPLYVLAQRKSYQLDVEQYAGREEVWQSSRQAYFYPRGDCEDHAILLADWLISMGEDARVVVGEMRGGGHAWVVLFKNGNEYLLEATTKNGISRHKPYPLAALFAGYCPAYMFNRESFWENTGMKFTTKYSGKHWVRKSSLRFKAEP